MVPSFPDKDFPKILLCVVLIGPLSRKNSGNTDQAYDECNLCFQAGTIVAK